MTDLRTFAEIAIGLLFAIGAVFNAAYTLAHGDELYGSFSKGSWFGPARWVIDNVVLNHTTAFTALLIAFQLTVAAMILTRGDLVAAGLLAGAAFAFVAALASSPGGTAANLALAGVQAGLAATQ